MLLPGKVKICADMYHRINQHARFIKAETDALEEAKSKMSRDEYEAFEQLIVQEQTK
jgi:hypothetical protein